jgi:hypothetical protein
MQDSVRLSEADIQDLAPLVEEFACRHGSCHKEMDLLAKRFEVPPIETYLDNSSSIASRSYAFLNLLNGTPRLFEAIDYILTKDFSPQRNDFRGYSAILMKYGFVIVTEENRFKLLHMPSRLLEEERKVLSSWIEQHASTETLSHLEDAKKNLARNRPDYALIECRKAIESLTTGAVGFSDSLTELANERVILQGSKNRGMDTEAIRTVYGYCSSLGAHASAGSPIPDLEQANLGIQFAESCIYFLLRRLEQAKANGKKLKCWV